MRRRVNHYELKPEVLLQTDEEFAGANQVAGEAFSSIRTVAAFQMEAHVGVLYAGLLRAPAKAARRAAWLACVITFNDLSRYLI